MEGTPPPAWFWIVALLGLLWECFGVAQYLMHVGVRPNNMEMSEAERSLMQSSIRFRSCASPARFPPA